MCVGGQEQDFMLKASLYLMNQTQTLRKMARSEPSKEIKFPPGRLYSDRWCLLYVTVTHVGARWCQSRRKHGRLGKCVWSQDNVPAVRAGNPAAVFPRSLRGFTPPAF